MNRAGALLNPFSGLSRWWEYRDLARNLIAKEIKVRYQGAWLGFAWSLMNPLLVTLMYLFVFTYVFRSNQPRHALYMVVGILHWTLFANVIGQAPELLVANSDLLKKIYFPRLLIPLSNFLVNFILWLMAFVVFMFLFFPLGGQFHWQMLAYPIYLTLFLGFSFGLVLTLCVLYVDFHDLKHIVEVIIQLLFWTAPIIYTMRLVPQRLHLFFYASPLVEFIQIFHALFWAGHLPSLRLTLAFSAWTVASLWLGLWLFMQRGARSVERL